MVEVNDGEYKDAFWKCIILAAKKLMENLRQIDVLLEFGLCDHHGKAALEWMYNNLDAAYKIMVN